VKRWLLLILFLSGCAEWYDNPFAIPRSAKVDCVGSVCCYPSDKKMKVCVSSDVWRSAIIYVKIIEK